MAVESLVQLPAVVRVEPKELVLGPASQRSRTRTRQGAGPSITRTAVRTISSWRTTATRIYRHPRRPPSSTWVTDDVDAVADEPLMNAAVERIRAGIASANVMERDEFSGGALTDDFVFDDRRSGFSYGGHDATTYREVSRSVFDVGPEMTCFTGTTLPRPVRAVPVARH